MFLSLCFRQSHNLKVVGSNPAPATNLAVATSTVATAFFCIASHCDPRYLDASLRVARKFMAGLDDEIVPLWDFKLITCYCFWSFAASEAV
jgi:hypothetical protein